MGKQLTKTRNPEWDKNWKFSHKIEILSFRQKTDIKLKNSFSDPNIQNIPFLLNIVIDK